MLRICVNEMGKKNSLRPEPLQSHWAFAVGLGKLQCLDHCIDKKTLGQSCSYPTPACAQANMKRCSQNPPTPLAGAGRASGAVVFELVTFAKASSSHIALLRGTLYFASRKSLRLQGHWGERCEVLKVEFGRIFGYVLPLLSAG